MVKKAYNSGAKSGQALQTFLALCSDTLQYPSPAALTQNDLLQAYGLVGATIACQPQYGQPLDLHDVTVLDDSKVESSDVEVMGSPPPAKRRKLQKNLACSAERCAFKPACLNYMGQVDWEDTGIFIFVSIFFRRFSPVFRQARH